MNPKDMTNTLLISEVTTMTIPCYHCGGSGLVYKDEKPHRMNEHAETVICHICDGTGEQENEAAIELLRRLDEADALRKENEELRNLFGECPKRNNRLGTYSDAKPVQIDVCKLICMTKESEASHD